MKFSLRDSLKLWAVATLAGLLLIFLISFLWLKSDFDKIESVHNQIDFVRSAQLHIQQIETSVERLEVNPASSPQIISALARQDQLLATMRNGGYVADTKVELKSLQKLPMITYAKLVENWKTYKHTILNGYTVPDSISNVDPQVLFAAQSLLVIDWYERLLVDLGDELAETKSSATWTSAICILIMIVSIALIVVGFIREIIRPLKLIGSNTEKFAHTKNLRNNELGLLAERINDVIEKFRDASDFVNSIGSGKLDMDYQKELDSNYTPGQNRLADSLIEMQGKLRELNQEDLRRKWANEGLAKFVDILRSNDNDLRILCDKIISNLVQYTSSNQGGLYILNEEDPNNKFLELLSLYAFNIKKFETQKVKLGEGLLGQAFLEKDTTYLTEIPEDYVRITSGLGDATPKSILIVPLKIDQDTHGLVELASFNEFKPHEIDFVERLGETIASTLASVKAAQNNRKLLEESKTAAEAMHAQEEEMRQNMEELTATQEEMQRILKEAQTKEAYLINLMNATTDAFVAIGPDYRVIMRNNAPLFERFAKDGIRYEPGFNVLSLFTRDEVGYHKELYDRTLAGERHVVSKEYYSTPYEITYSPLRSGNDEIIGVAVFAHDLTERKRLEDRIRQFEQQAGSATGSPSDQQAIEEMTRTLKFNLEALRITQEELKKKLG